MRFCGVIHLFPDWLGISLHPASTNNLTLEANLQVFATDSNTTTHVKPSNRVIYAISHFKMGQKLYPRATVKKIVKAHSNCNVSKNADVMVPIPTTPDASWSTV